jgi:hypothetical protein
MTRAFSTATILLVAALHGSAATAGAFTDDLTKCVVRSATVDDQLALVRWDIAMTTRNPALQSLSSITPEQREKINETVAALYQRLFVGDCRKETVAALKYEGSAAPKSAFGFLGRVATKTVMSDPAVMSEMRGLASYYDRSKWADLYAEAGLPPPTFSSR